jgi:hypothetical protein
VPNTSVRFAFYFENFTAIFNPFLPEGDGTYSLTLPQDGPMDGISVPDGVPIVAEVFKYPDK